jgi:serine/threonine protein kinase
VTFDEELNKRYEVLEEVGHGGQARVVHARDRLRTRHEVALKIYEIDARSRDELVREVDVLIGLPSHPNLPVVRNDEFIDDRYVIKMDWVDGRNLQQVLDQEGTPGLALARVVDVVTQIASALDHLHESDPPVIHGDVKPANIVLTRQGRAVLVDFGIAGGPAGRGTKGYCAPEVSAGGDVTLEADLYGLAATAWTLLTAEVPDASRRPPRELDARVVEALRPSLATSPSARPEQAGDLAVALADAVGPSSPRVATATTVATTPSVADAALAPTSLIAAGGVAAVTVVAGLAVPVVVAAGVVAWGLSTFLIRRRHRPEPIRPDRLTKEWGDLVREAQRAQSRYESAWRAANDGKTRERLRDIGASVEAGVRECWTVAKRSNTLAKTVDELDLEGARERLVVAEAEMLASPSPTRASTVASLTARMETGRRMNERLEDARDQLQMLDARLDEIATAALEIVYQSGTIGTVAAVGSAVDEVVEELQILAAALDEAADEGYAP